MSGVMGRLVRGMSVAALMLALACGGAFGAPATTAPAPAGAPSSASKTAPATTPARGSGAHAVSRSRARTAAPRRSTAARTGGSAPRSPASSAPGGAPRRLDEIAIEGEIPVPQVLFITARDQRRFLDTNPSRYVRTSRQVADATPTPTRVMVVGDTARAAATGGSK